MRGLPFLHSHLAGLGLCKELVDPGLLSVKVFPVEGLKHGQTGVVTRPGCTLPIQMRQRAGYRIAVRGWGPTDREVALPSMPRKKAVAVPGWSVGTATQRVKKMLGS